MPTAAKVAMVEALGERLGRSTGAVLAEFGALSVAEMTALRRSVLATGGELKIVKNTILGLAIRKAGLEGLDSVLTGPTAVVFAYDDPIDTVKVQDAFGQEHRDAWRVKAGVLEGHALSVAEVEVLAHVPGREQLLGQLAGLLASPATRLARVLSEPIAEVGRALGAVEKARQGEAA